MRALRVHAWGEAPMAEDCPAPEGRPGHTIVRVAAATVGHVDRTIWSGGFLRHPPLPYIPGVEAAGTVMSSAVYPPGARVWIRGGGLGTVVDGTWAELLSAPDAAVGPLPEGVSFAVGAAFFSPCTSAWVSLHDVASLRSGERVLVTGANGAVGALTVQLAMLAGARVWATVTDASRVGELPDGAVPVVVDRTNPSTPADLAVEILIDTVGGDLLGAVLPAVVPGGRAVLVGYVGGTTVSLDLSMFMQRDVALLPLNMMRREPAGRAVAPELLAQLADRRLRLDVCEFAFDRAMAALEWLVAPGHRGRAVLVS